jgi:hypothetical protein
VLATYGKVHATSVHSYSFPWASYLPWNGFESLWCAYYTLYSYVKQSGLAVQLSKSQLQMGDTRFNTVYLTLNSVQDMYNEVHEKL